MDWANRFGSTRLLDVLLFDPNNVKIFLIARERDVRGVLALMEQGVDPNTTCPERNYTPLIAAVFNQVSCCCYCCFSRCMPSSTRSECLQPGSSCCKINS